MIYFISLLLFQSSFLFSQNSSFSSSGEVGEHVSSAPLSTTIPMVRLDTASMDTCQSEDGCVRPSLRPVSRGGDIQPVVQLGPSLLSQLESREPFDLRSNHGHNSPVVESPIVIRSTHSADSHNQQLGVRFASRRNHQPIDKEAALIPDMAQHNPHAIVRSFKKGMISVADKASLVCKILSAGCGIMLAIGVGDYMFGDSFLTTDVQGKISILSAAGMAVFKKLSELLEKIKLRDECRLISYESRDKFIRTRQVQFPDIHYSLEEIKDYLRQNNGFVTLPLSSSFAVRSFIFNTMCFFESILGMCWAVTGGLGGVTTISGISDKNLMDLNNSSTYRTLTIVFTASTAIIVLLDKNRHQLKNNCENWIINYEMLLRYFMLTSGESLAELHESIRPVPQFLISADLLTAMEEAANLSTRN